MQRFCVTSLSKSRIVFTGECASSIYNLTCVRLLVEVFHSQVCSSEAIATAGTKPQMVQNQLQQLRSLGEQEVHFHTQLFAAANSNTAPGCKYTSDFVVVFVATKADMSANLAARQQQLANMASSGVCHVVVLLLPDVAEEESITGPLRAIDGVAVLSVDSSPASIISAAAVAATEEAATTTSSTTSSATAEENKAADDAAGLPLTPRQWATSMVPQLWSFVAQTRVVSGPLAVQCFGDSLTEGLTYKRGRMTFAAYGDFMMQQYLPCGTGDTDDGGGPPFVCMPCYTHGISGEVTAQIRRRFEEFVGEKKKKKNNNNNNNNSENQSLAGSVLALLAGTNDLGTGVPRTELLENLRAMVQLAQEHKMLCVLISIPSTALAVRNELYENREWVNAEIEKLAAECGGEFVDFFKVSSVEEAEEGEGSIVRKLRPDIAVDNLHLTEDGYRLLAKCVSKAVKRALRKKY